MIKKDGGGDNFWILWGGHSCYEGDIELMGGPASPPTRENPARNDSFWKKCSCEPCL